MLLRSRLVTASVVVAATVACGGSVTPIDSSSSSGTSGTGSGSGSGSGDVKTDGGAPVKDAGRPEKDAGPNDPECPKSFLAPPGNCTVGVKCTYPRGTCSCLGHCGGAPPPPDVDFSHWSCTPKRSDGCPEEAPQDGSACKKPAAICSYGDCCVQTFTCGQSGTWAAGPMSCPP